MGGINSLGGLNKVNVDFRPAIDANAPDNANANQPQHVEPDASDAQPSGAVAFKSVVKQLDVLLLNAAVWGAAILAAATGTTRILRVAAARGSQPLCHHLPTGKNEQTA